MQRRLPLLLAVARALHRRLRIGELGLDVGDLLLSRRVVERGREPLIERRETIGRVRIARRKARRREHRDVLHRRADRLLVHERQASRCLARRRQSIIEPRGQRTRSPMRH